MTILAKSSVIDDMHSYTSTRFKLFLLFIIVFVSVGLDQWTKVLAVQHFKGQATINFFGGLFQIVYAENPGAFLGMGSNLSREIRFVVFGLFVVLGLLTMLWAIVKKHIRLKELLAYSFILSGGIGNVIDRLTHTNGHVIDFMYIDLGFVHTGVFNVADMAIVLGFILAIWPEPKIKTINDIKST